MANNRMFFINDRLEVRITVAKFYPGGWSCSDLIGKIINEAFEADTDSKRLEREHPAVLCRNQPWSLSWSTNFTDRPHS
jgi:hypothetical protein